MTEERDPNVEPVSQESERPQEPEARSGWARIDEMDDTREKKPEKPGAEDLLMGTGGGQATG